MITTAELLKKLVGKSVDIGPQPGGHFIQEKRKKGEYIITDIGEQFLEAKATSLMSDTKKYYFNVNSILTIILIE
jgi:predicted transcriptional regulator